MSFKTLHQYRNGKRIGETYPAYRVMQRGIRHALLIVALFFTSAPHSSIAQEMVQSAAEREEAEHPPLLGDLGRSALEEQGFKFETLAINDFWANVAGGNYRGVGVMGNMNLMLFIDTSKAGWWDDGEFTFWGIGVYGRRPALAVGDYQYSDSIDAVDTFDPYEMYYEHSFLDDSVTVLAGIHDFSLEFAIIDYGFPFINSSFLTPSTITQIPFSFYPTTGLGSRASIQVSDEGRVLFGVYDGRPADLNNMRDKSWGISKREGLYSIAEAQWVENDDDELYGKVALGGWYNSGTFEDPNGVERVGNYGAYLLAEHQLWREIEGDTQGLGAFAQIGQAQNDRNMNPWYFGAGVRYQGAFEGRDEDVIGIGYAHAQMSSWYQENNPGVESSERAYELNYRAKISNSIYLTPDVQYIVNPAISPDAKNAVIVYLRTELGL